MSFIENTLRFVKNLMKIHLSFSIMYVSVSPESSTMQANHCWMWSSQHVCVSASVLPIKAHTYTDEHPKVTSVHPTDVTGNISFVLFLTGVVHLLKDIVTDILTMF